MTFFRRCFALVLVLALLGMRPRLFAASVSRSASSKMDSCEREVTTRP